MGLLSSFFRKKEKSFVIPDRFKAAFENRDKSKPINFGIKIIWCAVKTNDHKVVADFIDIKERKECDWIEGTVKAHEWGVFVMPVIKDWVLIQGWGLPSPRSIENMTKADVFLDKLSKQFGEAQLFGNHRVSSSAFWMLSRNGTLQRVYLASDGTGGTLGEPTEIEKKWKLIDLGLSESEMDERYYDEHIYPDEDHVIQVAENWSINPETIETMAGIGPTGICGKIRI